VSKKSFYELRNLVEQYYDVQQQRVQSYNRVVAWIKQNVGWEGVVMLQAQQVLKDRFNPNEIKALIQNDYESTIEAIEQKYNVVIPPLDKPYSWYADRLVAGKVTREEIENMVWCASELIRFEKELADKIKKVVSEIEVYDLYLSKIRGISHILAAGLIGWIAPIDRFRYSSRLRAYAGLSAQHYRMKCEDGHRIIATSPKETCPVRKQKHLCEARIVDVELVNSPPKRAAGYYTMINMRLKTHVWRCVRSFEYQNSRRSYYRYLYDRAKAYYKSRDGNKSLPAT